MTLRILVYDYVDLQNSSSSSFTLCNIFPENAGWLLIFKLYLIDFINSAT